MDRLERVNDLQVSASDAMRASRAEIWTALPGVVQSYNPAKMTAEVQPAIKARVMQRDGMFIDAALPLLVDCPVMFPGGGGFCLTFPLAKGDEVLVVFARSCIDAWWQQGGVQPQAELRMHDLSDGFALPRVWSQPNKPNPAPASDKVQLRNADGTVLFEVGAAGIVFKGPVTFDDNVNLVTANLLVNGTLKVSGATELDGQLDVNAPGNFNSGALFVNNAITAAGAITAGIGTGDQVGLQTHIHPVPGFPNTTSPIAGS